MTSLTETFSNVDFGNHAVSGSVGDFVWDDLDEDGIQDVDEPGLPLLPVHLLDRTGTVIASTLTNASGRYRFDGLDPNERYHIQWVIPDGYRFSLPRQGHDRAADSDADHNGRSPAFQVPAGQFHALLDAGVVQPLLIRKVEWVAQSDSPLTANPNAGGGLRIFPDKTDALDTAARNLVQVRVTLTRPVGNILVYMQLVDVDDPSSNAAPVDDETQRRDNRQFLFLFARGQTDANGSVLFTSRVSFQPGDNYRALATIRGAGFPGIQIPQNDGELARILDGAGNEMPTANALTVQAPELLTVWRNLRVEVDTMQAVAGNTVRGLIGPPAPGPRPGTSTVTTDQNLDDSANRFQNGKLTDSRGQVFTVTGNGTGPSFTVDVIGRPAPGAFSLVDDDLLKDGDRLQPPDTSTLRAAMAEAYVRARIRTSLGTGAAFVANVETVAIERQIITDNWTSRANNSPTFWVAYVLGAFQGERAKDLDPGTEAAVFGSTPNKTIFHAGGGSLIYLETIRDPSGASGEPDRPTVAVFEQDNVVHEVGHAVAGHGQHPVTGGDAYDPRTRRPIPIGTASPDGIRVAHHQRSKYQPAYIDWIRSASKPWS